MMSLADLSACLTGIRISRFFFFNDTATTEIYTLSLHDALPISPPVSSTTIALARSERPSRRGAAKSMRSEEHTSELQSRLHLVCRLLLEKKKKKHKNIAARQSNSIYDLWSGRRRAQPTYHTMSQ